jgi:dTMP kinase
MALSVHPDLTPDQTFVFDCSYEVSRSRLGASGRSLDRFEAEEQAFFERVRSAYRELAAAEPGRVRMIDGSRAPSEVQAEVEKQLISD